MNWLQKLSQNLIRNRHDLVTLHDKIKNTPAGQKPKEQDVASFSKIYPLTYNFSLRDPRTVYLDPDDQKLLTMMQHLYFVRKKRKNLLSKV